MRVRSGCVGGCEGGRRGWEAKGRVGGEGVRESEEGDWVYAL